MAAPAGSALEFNGSNQHVTFGAAPELGVSTFTIETWFMRTGAGVGTSTGLEGIASAVPLVTKGRDEAEGSNVDMNYFLGIDATSGKLVADFEEGPSPGGTLGLNHPISGNTVISNNVWHHAAATYDGQTWTLYLDGAQDGTLTLPAAGPPRYDSIQHAALATAMSSTGVSAGYFQGVLDEARVWNYARTAQQILDTKDVEVTTDSGLTGRWGMNEGSGTTVGDSSGSNLNGTAINAPLWVSGFPPNQDPSIINPGVQTNTEGNNVALQIQASDLDGDALTYSATGLPPGLLIGTNTGMISGTVSSGGAANSPYNAMVTVDDGRGGTASVGFTWTINPAPFNQPPIVNAGVDQTITLPANASLVGSVSDDGLPNPPGATTTTWSDVSGPGTVTFSNANASSTTASFSVPGVYVLRLTANDGALSSSDDVTITVIPVAGNYALDFGGTNAYVTFGNPSKLHLPVFTVEAKFKREGAGRTTYTGGTGGLTNVVPLVTRGRGEAETTSQDMNYLLGIDSATNTLAADFEEGPGGSSPSLNHPILGVTPISSNTWHHAAATYDGVKWQLFLDGVLEKELTVGQPAASGGNQQAAIGSALTTTGTAAGFFDGVIDEARIWSRALTEAEIQANLNLEITSASGLVARWGLNEGGGTSVSDSTSSPANGMITGSNWAWASGAPLITINYPPNMPVLNSPVDGTTDVATSPTLDVSVSDPDGDNLTVTYYGRPASSAPPGPDFTIIALPDTQFYVSSLNGGSPAIFNAETQWIVNNTATRNIVFVTQLGDCVQNGDNGGNPVEWSNADTAMSILEDPLATMLPQGIPYGIAVGNHDQSPTGNPNGTTTFYNQYFGVPRFMWRDYYGGHYGSNNDNHFELFSASGLDFIVIHLEYDPSANSSVLSWANSLLQTYSNRRAIVVSHYIINAGFNAAFSAQGEAIYNALKANPNLFLMLCGHVTPAEGQRQDTFNGNTVYSLMSDYQGRTNGGNGLLRIMEFSPADNQIRVKTYSPWLNQFETDADSQFTLSYDIQGSSIRVIGTNSNVPSGTSTTTSWANLSANTEYEWYATVSDGRVTTTGPTWRFTTAAAANQFPTITNPGDQMDAEGDAINLQIAASDPDQDTLIYEATNLPDGLSISPSTGLISGALSYTSSGSFNVTVTVDDNHGHTPSASFTWTVTHTNRSPSVTDPGPQTSAEGNAVNLQISATDPDGDSLTYTATGLPSGLSINGTTGLISGTVAFGAAANNNVTVTASDGNGGNNSASFTWAVTHTNRAPTADPQTGTAAEDAATLIILTASDPDGDPLTFSLVTGPSHGTFTGTLPNIIYTPAANFNGPDSFTFKASDGAADSNVATVSITVTPVNDPPVAGDDAYNTDQDTALTVAAPSVLTNDTDVDSPILTAVIVAAPSHGTLTLNSDGSFTYTPALDFNGTDSFTYKANDGAADSNVATVTITVRPAEIVFRSASFTQNSGATSIRIDKPAGVVAGDLMLASIVILGNPSITPPRGWFLIRDPVSGNALDNISGTALRQVTYYKVSGAGEPASYTWSFNGNQNASGGISAYSGVDRTAPFDVAAGQVNASSTSITAPELATRVANTRLVGFFGIAIDTTINPPAPMAERGEMTSGRVRVTTEIADGNHPVIGPAGARTATASVAAVNIGQAVALRPSNAETLQPPAPATLTATGGEGHVDLSWAASPSASGYNLYRSTTAGGPFDVTERIAQNITATSYTDLTVTNGTTYYYVVRAFNDNGESPNSPEASATPRVICPMITLSPSTLPAGKVGAAYSQSITASGSTSSYSYSLTSGSLPAGLTLSTSGGLSGKPRNGTGGKDYIFTITATDQNGCIGSQPYTLLINK